MSLLNSLRQSITPTRNILLSSSLRGPKKKSDKKGDGIVSEHILNIYKNNEDVPILPSEYYPKWVINMKDHPMSMEEFILNSYCGNCFPNYSEFHTLFKHRRRLLKKKQNRDLWKDAQYDQPKDDIASDDENLLEFENVEVERELNELEAAEGGEKPK